MTLTRSPYKLPQRRKRVKSGIERAPQRVWPRHRRFVKSRECCVPYCGSWSVDFAHIRSAANAGIALKPHDAFGVSLCRTHHREQHDIGQAAFEAKYAIDLSAIAGEFVRLSTDHKMRIALLEATLDTPAILSVTSNCQHGQDDVTATIPIVANPFPPLPTEAFPHAAARLSDAPPRPDSVGQQSTPHPARSQLPDAGRDHALVGSAEREVLHRDARDRRQGVSAQVDSAAGRLPAAHLPRPQLAHLERGYRPAPVPVDGLSTLEADIIRELRAVAARSVARVYRGSVSRAQALAMWRGWMEPAKALGFIQITRLGRKALTLAGEPPPIPRKTVEVYAPALPAVMVRVA